MGSLRDIEVDRLFGQHDVQVSTGYDPTDDDAGHRLKILFDDNGRGKTTVLTAVHYLLNTESLEYHLSALAALPLDAVRLTTEDGRVEFRRNDDLPGVCMVEAHQHGDSSGFSSEIAFDASRIDPRTNSVVMLSDRDSVEEFRDTVRGMINPPIFVADDRSIHSDYLAHFDDGLLRRSPKARRERPREARLREPSAELSLLFDELFAQFRRMTFRSRRTSGDSRIYADVVDRILDDSTDATGDVEAMRTRAKAISKQLELAEKYGLIDIDPLHDLIKTLNNMRKNARNKKTIDTVLHPYFQTLESEVERLTPGVLAIERFVTTANQFLRSKHLSYTPSDGLQVIVDDQQEESAALTTDQLSSGERHLLLLIGSAMVAPEGTLILLDEPELSLGIEWKRKLLQSLLDLTQESSAQFLVASHSVEIISPFISRASRMTEGA